MKTMGRKGRESAAAVLAFALGVGLMLAPERGAQGCELGSEVFTETLGATAVQAAIAGAEAATGKAWSDMDEATKRKVASAAVHHGTAGGATHAKTLMGVEWVEHWLRSATLPRGVYNIYSAEEDGGFVKVDVGMETFWIEASYGCYSVYSGEVLVWRGHGGQICSKEDYDPADQSC